jgi:hypothetical protein
MTEQDLTPEAVAAMLNWLRGLVTHRYPHQMRTEAADMLEAFAAKLAEVERERDELRAADRVHASARAGFERRMAARAEAAETDNARLREAINLTAEQALKDEIPGGYIPLSSDDWHAGYDSAIGRARAALKEKADE